jgi:hypothetical protein
VQCAREMTLCGERLEEQLGLSARVSWVALISRDGQVARLEGVLTAAIRTEPLIGAYGIEHNQTCLELRKGPKRGGRERTESWAR